MCRITCTSTVASLLASLLSGYLASTLLKSLDLHVLHLQFGPIDTISTGVGFIFLLAPSAMLILRRRARSQAQSLAKGVQVHTP
jgi:hypothetical protein